MKSSQSVYLILGILVVSLGVTTSCTTTSAPGGSMTAGSRLPQFSMGKKATYEWTVTGRNKRSFPYKLFIRPGSNFDSSLTYRSFDRARFRVEILDYNSRKVLARTEFRCNTWRFVGNYNFEQVFWGFREPSLGHLENYRVRLTVLVPAKNPGDRGQLVLY